MIDQHDFNSEWWGEPVGILRDTSLFEGSESEVREELDRFAWIEYRADIKSAPHAALTRFGFFFVDTQIEFRIGLKRVSRTPSIDRLTAKTADETEVRIIAPAPFESERFVFIPGATNERVSSRYIDWGNDLIQRNPANCLAIYDGDALQGWFLSEEGDKVLRLTLAMLHRDATIAGSYLYHRALVEYGARGHRIGWARFSATNLPVLNIYSTLGAQFTGAEGCWLRVRR